MSTGTSLVVLFVACSWAPEPEPVVPPVPPAPVVEPDLGKWFETRTHAHDPGLSEAQRAEIEQLEALGYADGTDPGHGATGVTVHDRQATSGGFNFFASGHGPEAVLVDMDGRELHRWHHEFWDAFADYPVKRSDGSTHNFRRARLLSDGSVLAIHEGLGMIRIDAESRLLWAFAGRPHHDLEVHGDRIYTLTREVHLVDGFRGDRPTVEDFVSVLDVTTGRELQRVSLLAAVRGHETHRRMLDTVPPKKGDVFHSNSVHLLDGDVGAGRVMVSMRTTSAVVVVDLNTGQLEWAQQGPWRAQHDARVQEDGNLWLFDNRGLGKRRSRVLRVGWPETDELWSWAGPEASTLNSGTLGSVDLLADGHVLVTESERGRAVELDPDTGAVVWEFHNPHQAGPNGQFVAALFELVRLGPDFDVSWARGTSTPPRAADP